MTHISNVSNVSRFLCCLNDAHIQMGALLKVPASAERLPVRSKLPHFPLKISDGIQGTSIPSTANLPDR